MNISLYPQDLLLVLLPGPGGCEELRVTGHFQLGLKVLVNTLPLAWEAPSPAPSVHHLMHHHLIKIDKVPADTPAYLPNLLFKVLSRHFSLRSSAQVLPGYLDLPCMHLMCSCPPTSLCFLISLQCHFALPCPQGLLFKPQPQSQCSPDWKFFTFLKEQVSP